MSILRQGIVCCVLLCSLFGARADALEDRLNTVWESLWQQTGTPTQLVRWEQDIRYRIIGVNLSSHRDHAIQAMNAVSQVTGVKATDVSDQPDAQTQANLTLEFVTDGELQDNQPCVTYTNWRAWKLEKVTIKMRTSQAWRCNVHETMHAMGIQGHPSGKTVLSYFPWRRDQLMDMDQLMLRAWYSPRMRAGMTPFEALAVLADEVVASTAERDAAPNETREQFFKRTMSQMKDYASGNGELPRIVLRSGKASTDGIQNGALQMAYFVGVAYAKGATVAADPVEAVKWFRWGANKRNLNAMIALASAYESGEGVERDEIQAYAWFNLADALRRGAGKSGLERLTERLSADQIQEANRRLVQLQPSS